jgi:hypothetical protein
VAHGVVDHLEVVQLGHDHAGAAAAPHGLVDSALRGEQKTVRLGRPVSAS